MTAAYLIVGTLVFCIAIEILRWRVFRRKPAGTLQDALINQMLDKQELTSRPPWPFRRKAIVGSLIRVCPGRMHAWYESNVGPIRKPIQ
jgi:hypothetical protein